MQLHSASIFTPGLDSELGFCHVCHNRGEVKRDARVKLVVKREEMRKGCGSISQSSISPRKWCFLFVYPFRPLTFPLCGDVISWESVGKGGLSWKIVLFPLPVLTHANAEILLMDSAHIKSHLQHGIFHRSLPGKLFYYSSLKRLKQLNVQRKLYSRFHLIHPVTHTRLN